MTDELEEPDTEGQDTGPEVEEQGPRRIKRSYTDDERIAAVTAVEANGGNVYATACELGIPEPTLRQWVKGDRCEHLQPVHEQKRRDLARRFVGLAEKMLGVAERKADELDAKSATIAAAVAVDKALLLTGEATSIVESRNPEQEARADAIRSRYGRRLTPVQATPHAPAPSSPDAGAAQPPSISPHSVGGAAAESPAQGTAPDAPRE